MSSIDKVDAFIKIADAINSGENKRVNSVGKIVAKSIEQDMQKKSYSSSIDLKRKESKIFAR